MKYIQYISSLWFIIFLAALIIITTTANATYKEIEVGNGTFTVSFDIKGDPVSPFESPIFNQAGIKRYQILLKDKDNRSRTTIQIDVSGSGFTQSGSVGDVLGGFSDVREYSREIDGHQAEVATGIHPKGTRWTVFQYYLDNINKEGWPTNAVMVYCTLPEANAGDLMNTLHVGKKM